MGNFDNGTLYIRGAEVDQLLTKMDINEKVRALKDKQDPLLCYKLVLTSTEDIPEDLKTAIDEFIHPYGSYSNYFDDPEVRRIIHGIPLEPNPKDTKPTNLGVYLTPKDPGPTLMDLYPRYTVSASDPIKTSKISFWIKLKDILENACSNAGTILFWIWFTLPITLFILVKAFKLKSPVLTTLNKYSYFVYVITLLIQVIAYVASAIYSGLKAAMPNGKVLGITSLEQNHFEDAIESFQHYLQENPDDRECLYLLGLAYDNNHQEDMALSWYNTLLEIQPYHTEALNNKGRILYARHDFQNAKTCFERAAEMGSNEAKNNLEVMHRYGRG
jgi:hypothetical protein